MNYLAQAAEFLGNGTPERIVQLGEGLPLSVHPFAVLPEFAHLRYRFGCEFRESLPAPLSS